MQIIFATAQGKYEFNTKAKMDLYLREFCNIHRIPFQSMSSYVDDGSGLQLHCNLEKSLTEIAKRTECLISQVLNDRY